MSHTVVKKSSREAKVRKPTEKSLAADAVRANKKARHAKKRSKQQAYTEKAKAAELKRFQLLQASALTPEQEAEARLAPVRRCRRVCGGDEVLGADPDHHLNQYQCAQQVDLVIIEGVAALRCDAHGFVEFESTEMDTLKKMDWTHVR